MKELGEIEEEKKNDRHEWQSHMDFFLLKIIRCDTQFPYFQQLTLPKR
jgi:hypothetical protein